MGKIPFSQIKVDRFGLVDRKGHPGKAPELLYRPCRNGRFLAQVKLDDFVARQGPLLVTSTETLIFAPIAAHLGTTKLL